MNFIQSNNLKQESWSKEQVLSDRGKNALSFTAKQDQRRLVLEARSSQYDFDAMFKAFGDDIPHCLNRRNDILLGGRGEAVHKETLKTVLQRARDRGVTFNKKKCQFGKEQIEFFGHVVTMDGLKPSPDKVKAIKEWKPFRKQKSRKTFSWNGRLFGPKTTSSNIGPYSSTTYQLTQKGGKFKMGEKRRKSIQEDTRQHLKRQDSGIFYP